MALLRLGRPIDIFQGLDAGVVDENMELALEGCESVDGPFDGGQVGEVEMEVCELSVGRWVCLFDVGDCSVGALFGPGGDVDFGVLGVQQAGSFFTYASVGARDDKHLH